MDSAGCNVLTIPIDQVHCRKDHIRKSSRALDALQETIEDAGLLQPILVSKAGDGSFNIIDGARRLAALRELGVRDLIVGREIIIDTDEREADVRFKQVIANLQREDLNPVEIGRALVTLKEEYGYQYSEIAEIIGKTPHYVAAKVGLIKRLDPKVRRLYMEDLAREKCNQSTSSGDSRPYLINLNVVEDIARVPLEHQMAAYETIGENRMEKGRAIEYLRMLKNPVNLRSLVPDEADTGGCTSEDSQAVLGVEGPERRVRKQLGRISSDIEQLSESLKGCCTVEPEIVVDIEEIIGTLTLLCDRLKTDRRALSNWP